MARGFPVRAPRPQPFTRSRRPQTPYNRRPLPDGRQRGLDPFVGKVKDLRDPTQGSFNALVWGLLMFAGVTGWVNNFGCSSGSYRIPTNGGSCAQNNLNQPLSTLGKISDPGAEGGSQSYGAFNVTGPGVPPATHVLGKYWGHWFRLNYVVPAALRQVHPVWRAEREKPIRIPVPGEPDFEYEITPDDLDEIFGPRHEPGSTPRVRPRKRTRPSGPRPPGTRPRPRIPLPGPVAPPEAEPDDDPDNFPTPWPAPETEPRPSPGPGPFPDQWPAPLPDPKPAPHDAPSPDEWPTVEFDDGPFTWVPGSITLPDPRTDTDPDTDPDPDPSPDPDDPPIVDNDPPVRAPPKGDDREVKVRFRYGALAHLVFKVFGTLTEVSDAVDAIFDALPKKCRLKAGRPFRHNGKLKWRFTMQRKIDVIMGECFDEIDWDKAIENLVLNEVQDRAIGKLNSWLKQSLKNNPYWQSLRGPTISRLPT